MGFTAMSRGFFAQRRKQSLLRARRFCHRTRLATEMLEDRLAPAVMGPTLQLVPASGPTITLALDTFQFGAQHPVILTNGQFSAESGRTQFDSLDVTADRSSNSPALFQALTAGAPYKTATLTETNAAGQPVAAWAMSTVYVTGDTTTGTGDTNPTSPAAEELELTFGAVTVANSAAAASWSQVSNAPQGPPPPTGLAPTPVFIPSPDTISPTLELDPAGGAPPIYLDLTGFQFGAQNNIAPSAANFKPGKMQFDSLDVTTALNGSSPALFAALAGGGQFTTVTLREYAQGGSPPTLKPFATWVMSTVYVTGDTSSWTDANGRQLPVEELKLTFAGATTANGTGGASSAAGTGPTLQLVPARGPTITLALGTFQSGVQNSVTIGTTTAAGGPGSTPLDSLDTTTGRISNSPALFGALTGGDMKTATRVLGRRPWRVPSAASHRARLTGDSRPVPAQPLPNLSRRAIAARHTGSSGG